MDREFRDEIKELIRESVCVQLDYIVLQLKNQEAKQQLMENNINRLEKNQEMRELICPYRKRIEEMEKFMWKVVVVASIASATLSTLLPHLITFFIS
jgi:hypothetical protein